MKPEKAKLVVDGLKEAGVDFTAGVPDAQFIQVYKMLEEDPDIRYVGTANEAEAAGVGYGAWFGGKKPALMLATSGLLVATYHLARINILHEVPLLILERRMIQGRQKPQEFRTRKISHPMASISIWPP